MDIPSSEPNPTWAVIVVHGVGASSPGATLDAFVPAVIEESAGNLAEVEPPEILLLPEPVEADRFPMHLRRIRVKQPRKSPSGADTPRQALFAEVYWGDLSRTGEGLLAFLLQLLTMLFHARYLSDRAAAYPRWPSARFFRFTLYLGAILLCGPIAAGYTLL